LKLYAARGEMRHGWRKPVARPYRIAIASVLIAAAAASAPVAAQSDPSSIDLVVTAGNALRRSGALANRQVVMRVPCGRARREKGKNKKEGRFPG
jgi:hypothetical protein